jgi:hypothetical protein
MGRLHNAGIKTVAYPAAAANVSTAALDLGPTGGAGLTGGQFVFRNPALAALVDAKTVTITLTDCDTLGGTYSAVEGYGNMVLTGAGGAGAAAKDFRMPIARHVRQFVKANVAVLTGGGTLTASTFTFAIELDQQL